MSKPHTQPQPSLPTYYMITRLKAGIFKPKTFRCDDIAAQSSLQTPFTIAEALSNEGWRKAMQDEFQALMLNNTWSLVPHESHQNVIDSKWVFKTKYNADGSVSRLMARLVAKG